MPGCISLPKLRRRTPIPIVTVSAENQPISPSTSTALSSNLSEKRVPSSLATLSPSPGVGWGKVIASGRTLSVSWGTANSRQDLTSDDTSTTAKLADLRRLMKTEPEPLDY